MNNTNETNTNLSRFLITFGIIGMLISTIDILYIIFPLRLSSPEWVFNTAQSVVNSLLAPSLCLVLLLCGIYFVKDYLSQKSLIILEKLTSITALVFGLLICSILLLYSLSMKTYEAAVVTSLKMQSENVISQIDKIYKEKKINISEKVYNDKVSEIKKGTNMQVKHAKKIILLKTIKSIAEMILYTLLFFIIGIFSFNSSKSSLSKLKFSK